MQIAFDTADILPSFSTVLEVAAVAAAAGAVWLFHGRLKALETDMVLAKDYITGETAKKTFTAARTPLATPAVAQPVVVPPAN